MSPKKVHHIPTCLRVIYNTSCDHTLYTLLLSVSVSNIEYMPFNIETTSIGVIRLHISVNVTTSEKSIETLSNIWRANIQTTINSRKKTNSIENFSAIPDVKMTFPKAISLCVCMCDNLHCNFHAIHSPRTYQLDFRRAAIDRLPVSVSFDTAIHRCVAFLRPIFASILPVFSISAALDPVLISIPPTAAFRPTSDRCIIVAKVVRHEKRKEIEIESRNEMSGLKTRLRFIRNPSGNEIKRIWHMHASLATSAHT